MSDYRPSLPFNVSVTLLTPTTEKIKGVFVKKYPENGELIKCSFKTYGGTEKQVNGVTVIEDTATVETWYRPDIKAESRIVINDKTYEVIGEPENINMRNQFMKFKVKRVAGGA